MADRSCSPAPPGSPASEAERWAAHADAWERHADALAHNAATLNAPLVDALAVPVAGRLLDLASGAGEPAITLARAAGPQGLVVASDIVPAMVAAVMRRAATQLAGAAGHITAIAADMTRLPFADAAFDRVSCRFGLMFVPEPTTALGEILRVLRPSGRCGFLIWGAEADNTLFAAVVAACRAVLGADYDRGQLSPFRFAPGMPGALDLPSLLARAGFCAVEDRAVRLDRVIPPPPPGAPPFWTPMLDMHLGPQTQRVDAALRDALDRAMSAVLAPARQQGGWQLAMHARVVCGSRP